MKRDYLTFSPDEFKLLGRLDALTDGKEQTNEIIRSLSVLLQKKDIITNVTNYLVGYKIGTLESLYKKHGQYLSFDFESKSFKYPDGKEPTAIRIGYSAFEEESRKEAMKLLKL